MEVIGSSARAARRHKRRADAEINLVSMIDMLTILVFFLLVHGGFVRLAILELSLPTGVSEPTDEAPEFMLEVTVRETGIEVGDRATGLLTRIENTAGEYDLVRLSEYLESVKQQFPGKTDATVLLEPDIEYETLVSVMDTVREVQRIDTSGIAALFYRAELFPEISIGDAPLVN